jgi:hypothetical protein
MRSPLAAGRNSGRFTFKASHRRMSLRISHRTEQSSGELNRAAERPPNIAPPKKR